MGPEMKTKLGTIKLDPSEDSKTLTITLHADQPIELNTAVQFLDHLKKEILDQIKKIDAPQTTDTSVH